MFDNFRRRANLTVKIILLLCGLFLLSRLAFWFTVRYGQAAIVSRFGKIVRIASPGFHFKLPAVEQVNTYITQKLIYETSEYQDQSQADYRDTPVDTSTKDGQQVSIRYTIRFQVQPARLKEIAENLGDEQQIVERVIKTESRSVVRNVAREFQAQELYTGDVFQFQKRVSQVLKKSFAQNNLTLDEFLVRQVKFSEEYFSAVEQKQIQKEMVKTEEYKAEQEKYKKQAKITRAEGEGKAQEILKLTIDPLVLEKMAIEKWNGSLPLYWGSSSPLPFFNIK